MPQLSPALGILFFLFIFISVMTLLVNLSLSPRKISY